MSEESTFQNDDCDREGTPYNPSDVSENRSGDDPEVSRQDIFAAKFGALSDEFGRYCEKHNIEHAVIVATDGELSPMLFSNSDLLATAAILAGALRPIKEDINTMIKVD